MVRNREHCKQFFLLVGRAAIDPGAAQRIVGIADRGDRAIIALTACQAYVEKVSKGEG